MGRTPVRYGVGVATDLRSHLGTPVVRAPLPIAPSFAPLFADGGLVRGRTVACTGDAALSTALALSASATRLGSWLAVIGVPQLGVGAAIEAGVAIERIVLAQPPRASREWVATVAALVEGFDVLIVAPPASLSAHDARRLQTRVTARQSVLIVVHLPPPLAPHTRLAPHAASVRCRSRRARRHRCLVGYRTRWLAHHATHGACARVWSPVCLTV